jgi:uncharacterized repeat protein (TIGR02543 family)
MAFAVLALATAASIVASPLASAATITTTPTNDTIDVAGSTSFTEQLISTGNDNTVVYTQDPTGQSPDLIVNGNGLINVVGGPLAVGDYTITGTTADGGDDQGSWTYTLAVTPDTITTTPTTATIDVAGSTSFHQQLSSAGNNSSVTYTQGLTNQSPHLSVTGAGLITVVGGPLAVGNYTVSGTSADNLGDQGNWSYALAVSADVIVQGPPTSGFTTIGGSGAFATALSASSGFIGPVTFFTATAGFTISNGDELQSTGSLGPGGSPYTVTGTDSDADGDHGTWSYSLTVSPNPVVGSTTLTQTSPTTGSASTTSSGTFTAGPITVTGNTGTVTFVTTNTNPDVTVSSSGLISTTGTLAVGTYNVSGTDSDTHGDAGTWSYTLSVTAAPIVVTVNFDANGGTGTMAPESESAPTALSLNGFIRAGYTFVNWNTSAKGTGTSYANGAMFSFTAATKLFAQWKKGRAPSRTVTFLKNGGAGATASEVENTPTALRSNHFTRTGYTFVDWNTKAKGTGQGFKPGATYSFKKSITLFAQWKKVPKAPPKVPPAHVVTFAANGGAGSMPAESHRRAFALTSNHFTRSGYTFVDWNTKVKGSGTAYSNRETYSFGTSLTLYAQWKKNKVVTPPTTIPGGVTIGPFAIGSSSLTSALESQIQSLANEVQAKADNTITLHGFGDKTSTNAQLGRTRAGVVATYLEARLTALGLKGWTISIEPSSPNQLEVGTVVATLS